jgi:hypothetical protein
MRHRRRRLPRRPAARALEQGRCMFSPLRGCDGNVTVQALGWDALVLVCDRHIDDLLALRHDLAETRRIRRYLGHKFEAYTRE